MKSHLIICILVLFLTNMPAARIQTQSSQEKIEAQGALKLGEAQTRTLAPGTVHVWSITLESGQYAVVEVLQKGIDVVVQLMTPYLKPLIEVNFTDRFGQESLSRDANHLMAMRRTYGDPLFSTYGFLDAFNPHVPTMEVTGRDGKKNASLPVWKKPVVLIIDENVRSGKEMVALMLKKHRIATLVGERSAGAVMAGRAAPGGELAEPKPEQRPAT